MLFTYKITALFNSFPGDIETFAAAIGAREISQGKCHSPGSATHIRNPGLWLKYSRFYEIFNKPVTLLPGIAMPPEYLAAVPDIGRAFSNEAFICVGWKIVQPPDQ